ncbi:hypothetical protein A9Q84_05645 [Halobacteriovorax marinus]|uniref:Uncharacterized protein n=1 Tax=Halobacteriovorax marinus TaxID=97084 RepID=A0A1Y5FBB1_9BACT|nr:hypothetical protein A9Q84_05645 [Halobacteriovorax marinus]
MSVYQEVQNKIIDDYMGLLSRNTIRDMANDCGIQKTRLFRIMNGHEMKLSEYLTLKHRISTLLDSRSEIENLAKECDKILSPRGVSEISNYMKRRVRIAQFKANVVAQKMAA